MDAIVNAPVIIELGKTSKKNIRRLKQGRGKLLGDVEDAIHQVKSSLGDQANGKQLVPVVLVYRRRRKRGGGRGLFPVLF